MISNNVGFDKWDSDDFKLRGIYTQLQKKPIGHFSGQLRKSELRNENIYCPQKVGDIGT